jgi:hypothetical protein
MFRTLLQNLGVLPQDKELSSEALSQLPDAEPTERPDAHELRDNSSSDLPEDMATLPDDFPPNPDEFDDIDDLDILDDDEDEAPFSNNITTFEEIVTAVKGPGAASAPDGNDHTRPKSLEEAKARYGFIETIYRQAGIEDTEATDAATMSYADYRRRNRIAYYNQGQIEGWRIAAIEQRGDSVNFHGVTDDGIIVSKGYRKSFSLPEEFEFDGKFDWTFSDPIACTKQLAEATLTNEAPQNTHPQDIPDLPLIIQSHSFARNISDRRMSILSATRTQNRDIDYSEKGDKARTKISHVAKQDEIRRYGAMTNAFMKALDPSVQKIMRSTAVYNHEYANWLSGKAYQDGNFERDHIHARNRQRAVEAYPLFANKLRKTMRLRDTIDQGRPLNPALSKSLEVPLKTVPKLQGLTWQKVGRDVFHEPRALLKMVAMIDSNHVPNTRSGFAGLQVSTTAACHLALASNQKTPEDLLTSVGGRFEKIKELSHNNPPAGISDMATDIRNKLVGPAIFQTAMKLGLNEKEAAEFSSEKANDIGPLDGLSVRNAMEASIRWHRNERVYKAKLEDPEITGDDHWNTLVGELDLEKGYHAKERDSTSELKRAGEKHNNCIGGYTDDVLHGRSIVVGIYKGDEMVSNLELTDFFDGHQVEDPATGEVVTKRDTYIQQNLGYNNSDPSPAVIEAGKRLKKHVDNLPEGDWDKYEMGLEEAKQRRKNRIDLPAVTVRAGYHATSREKLETAWEHYKELLPKADRKKGLDGWIEDRIEPIVKQDLAIERSRNAKRDARSLLYAIGH